MAMNTSQRARPVRSKRVLLWGNLVVFLVSLVAIAFSGTYLAHRPALRARIDSTKTRAYSLSQQTQTLLSRLTGDWTISLVFVRDEVDRATLRQVEEVLQRFQEASNALEVMQIDPTDPTSISGYETLLEQLRSIYAEPIRRYEFQIDEARQAYERAEGFAKQEMSLASRTLGPLASGDPARAQIERARQSFVLLANNARSLITEVNKAMAFSEMQPIPDYERARDTLVAALTAAARDLSTLAQEYDRRLGNAQGVAPEVTAYLMRAKRRYESFATDLQSAADPLIHLKPLEITTIGRELARGEAAVIMSPDEAAVIPAAQLLPRSNLRATQQGGITFDRRFRGEQLLASTIRSLIVDHMPMVVFVHAQPGSMFETTQNRLDLFGVRNLLDAARYDVREWSLISGTRPEAEEGQPIVWVIVPPPFVERLGRSAFEISEGEKRLLEATDALLREGASILLPLYPSTLHRFGQEDPWQSLVARFGIESDTARILSHTMMDSEGRASFARSVEIVNPGAAHPIASAIYGQRLRLQLPVVLQSSQDGSGGAVETQLLLRATPDGHRFLDPEWTRTNRETDAIDSSWTIEEPVSLAFAASRPSPGGEGRQRAIVIGSVDWMFSALADSVVDLGGGRVALLYPGNVEFLQASIAWLAGMDDLIAQSPTAQQVSRLDGIESAELVAWRWGLIGGLPAVFLILGVVMWLIRRV